MYGFTLNIKLGKHKINKQLNISSEILWNVVGMHDAPGSFDSLIIDKPHEIFGTPARAFGNQIGAERSLNCFES